MGILIEFWWIDSTGSLILLNRFLDVWITCKESLDCLWKHWFLIWNLFAQQMGPNLSFRESSNLEIPVQFTHRRTGSILSLRSLAEDWWRTWQTQWDSPWISVLCALQILQYMDNQVVVAVVFLRSLRFTVYASLSFWNQMSLRTEDTFGWDRKQLIKVIMSHSIPLFFLH